MEHALFMWNALPTNYIGVCLESLRRYNKHCKIHFLYRNCLVKHLYSKYDINFIKLSRAESKKKLVLTNILTVRKLCLELKKGDKILILDPDILFQDDPFLMFKEHPQGDRLAD